MPAFGTAAVRDMFPDMLDLATQLTLKWNRWVMTFWQLAHQLIQVLLLRIDSALSIGLILRRTLRV